MGGSAAAASASNGGRERAIEALIDREPNGDFYRAARVVDEAVPAANAARPNLVTKSALVEQAFALQVYDVDSVAKYDNFIQTKQRDSTDASGILSGGGSGSSQGKPADSSPSKPDTLTKERVLHYQAKIAAAKQYATARKIDSPAEGASSSTSTDKFSVTPPASLVAALRQIYEENMVVSPSDNAALSKLKVETSNVLFELRHLLEAVSNHPIFPGAGSSAEDTSSSSIASNSSTTTVKQTQANLEKLIANVLKQATEQQGSGSSSNEIEDSETTLQGLLIAILSVLTGQKRQSQTPPAVVEEHDPKKRTKIASAAQKKAAQQQQQEHIDDVPSQPALQVGALLSLLPLKQLALDSETADATEEKSEDAATEGHRIQESTTTANAQMASPSLLSSLDPALLEYFGAAAAVYEERLEIQKARMLARVQTPPAKERSQSVSPPPLLVARRRVDSDDDDDESADDDDEEEEEEDGTNSIVETPTMSRRDNSGAMDPSGEEASTTRNTVESEIEEAGSIAVQQQQNANGDEEEDVEDNDDEEESSDSEAEEEISEVDEEEPYESYSDGLGESGDEEAQEDVVEDDGSSSSSSSSEESYEQGEAMDSDDADDEVYTDEEDEAVLRQALAMSMAEADAVEAAASAGVGTDGAGGNSTAPGPQDDGDATSRAVSPTAETPATRSVDEQQSVDSVGEDDLEEDAGLPPFPKPPTAHPFSFQVGSSGAVSSNDPDASSEKVASPLFNPSQLLDFGSLPSSHVLFYLLRYTEVVVALRLQAGRKSLTGPTVVVGGMGTALFPPEVLGVEAEKAKKAGPSDAKQDFTLQLLVASFLLMVEQRDDAIENLRKAVMREQRFVRDGGFDSDDDCHDDNDSSSAPLSGEEDDPALTLAMNYVEDDIPLSSDSLENKGMRRKAAAAAHDAAALLKSLRNRTAAWKNEVRLHSLLVGCSMKLFRQFLQSVVRQSLAYGGDGSLSVLDFHAHLPSFTATKLSAALDTFSDVKLHTDLLSLLGGAEAEVEHLYQSTDLYRESIFLWGECVPLLYSSDDARSELLKEMMAGCASSNLSGSFSDMILIDDLKSFPVSEIQPQFHRLTVLCRRLRVGDTLDCFVSRPVPYLADEIDDSEDSGDHASNTISWKLANDPNCASALISFLSKSIGGLVDLCPDVKFLYLSLCHRCHSRILLLDGFYSTTETEADGPLSSAAVAKTISTGDTVRVSAHPSSSLQFDQTKMSDSIALLSGFGDTSAASGSGSSSVHQRASKVWGAVLSTRQYSPKTGVHRWAVRLDKCERGHVFIGVATAQATTRTYVGGDKYGWGMIGTQALWHDRRKIRGDYGATFRTGSTIIVTLDTDAGTLSFSSWKASSSSCFSVDPLVQNILSPKRSGQIGGTIDDWGIAFEGLPLDSKLYPAVGLYQRDDRVTLLSVESSGTKIGMNGMAEISGGECYYPRSSLSFDDASASEYAGHIRKHNDLLTWDGIRYAAETLQHASSALTQGNADDSVVVRSLLASLGSALCLLPPSIPVLSARCALSLMPRVSRCILELEKVRAASRESSGLLSNGFREGKWTIRAVGSPGASSAIEEYVVDFSVVRNETGSIVGIEGRGVGTSGRSKNSAVKIIGCLKGTSLTLVEDWSEEQEDSKSANHDSALSCVVGARLSINGARFEGVYRNVSFEESGQIVGILHDERVPDMKAPLTADASFETCEALLCLAQSHLATILADDAAGDFGSRATSVSNYSAERRESLHRVLNGPLLSTKSSPRSSKSSVADVCESLQQIYSRPSPHEKLPGIRCDYSLMKALDVATNASAAQEPSSLLHDISECVASWDDALISESGGHGSLRTLCPAQYAEARRQIICALSYHCGLGETMASNSALNSMSADERDQIRAVWRAALKIMENGVRTALSLQGDDETRSECCSRICMTYKEVSDFLLELHMDCDDSRFLAVEAASTEFSILYGTVNSRADLVYIENEMEQASKRAFLRLVSFREVAELVGTLSTSRTTLIESLLIGIPRQFGRGKGYEPESRRTVNGAASRDLGGSFLSHLSGSCLCLKNALREQLFSVFQSLGLALENAVSETSAFYLSAGESFVLSAVSMFIGHMRPSDIDEIISKSNVLSALPKIFAAHRFAILRNSTAKEEIDLSFSSLEEVCHRDISRAVLRCAVAAAHVITYQAAESHMINGTDVTCTAPSVAAVLAELGFTMSFIKEASKLSLTLSVAKKMDAEWECWIHSQLPESSGGIAGKKKEASGIQKIGGAAGLQYLRDHGTTINTFGRVNAVKVTPSKSSSGGSPKKRPDNSNRVAGGFAHQFLSHWLHIVSSILRSRKALAITSQDSKLLQLLMKGIGLSVEYRTDGTLAEADLLTVNDGILPARFRARLLRLVLPLLASSHPCQAMVEALFHLAGAASIAVTESVDSDETLVSREAISLLRHLHSPIRVEWRASINRSILTITADRGAEHNLVCKRIGVLSFFSGSLETVGRGSYILLKPACSAAVSPDHQSSPSSRSHPSGIGGGSASAPTIGATPHHVVGNGTESLLAGLCRNDASAGIVSNVDLKNGICEVILVSRSQSDPIGEEDDVGQRTSSTVTGSNMVGGRHSLSVRALRAPLADVVHAQEVPLFLDENTPFEELTTSLLSSSVSSLLTAVRDQGTAFKEEGTSISEGTDMLRELKLASLTVNLMTIRCCIVLLSDPTILRSFINSGTNREILANILDLAWPDEEEPCDGLSIIRTGRNKGVSALPIHEARYAHLASIATDLQFRMRAMQETPDDHQKRVEMLRLQLNFTLAASDRADADQPPGPTPDSEPAGRTSTRSTVGTNSSREMPRRSISQSTAGGSASEDDEEDEAAATAAAHLREAAIAQMAELGLPRSWSELALRRTGGVNIEAAVTFCLERGAEMERMLAEERERDRHVQNDESSGGSRRRGGRDSGPSNQLLRQLLEMGFPRRWCIEALAVTGNNVDEALTWILANGERLGEEDETIGAEGGGDDLDEEDSAEDEDEDETEFEEAASDAEAEDPNTEDSKKEDSAAIEAEDASGTEPQKAGWTGSVIPIRFISGRAIVNPTKMEISGLPSGGFSSVGTKGVLLTSGKWYYEAILETAGCLQLGWADGSFAGHCHADRGDGCGDGPSSWAFDGWRRYRWHATATEWGCRWKEGDVVGCMVDMDEKVVSFTLNGQGESIGMGVAFTAEGFRPCGGVYACVSFNRREKLRLILGGSGSEPFKHEPPAGYQGVGEAVLSAVKERESLVAKESILDPTHRPIGEEIPKRFICDFSDSEHGHELMAWTHRYYGSDASVHLGSGRSRHSSGKSLSPSASSSETEACVTRRLEKSWSDRSRSNPVGQDVDYENAISRVLGGYREVQNRTYLELYDECILIAIILSRKLLLHLLVTAGNEFNPCHLLSEGERQVNGVLKLWKVVEVCTSLRSAGWVGEAGAMAIAAEALGLGISSNDQMQARSPGERIGVACFDDGVCLPTGGITQLLSSVLFSDVGGSVFNNTSSLPVSSAEAAMGSDGGSALLAFLQEGLQAAVCRSKRFRDVLVAVIRRSVRLLAVAEHDGDDFEAEEREPDIGEDGGDRPTGSITSTHGPSKTVVSEEAFASLPDARLTAFVTGLLLSKPVQSKVQDFTEIQEKLFEAWSVGLLSGSLPWRMVCAFTAAGILNMNPAVMPSVLRATPILARYFGRLESTVARRLWSERAALPVGSRYAQSLVELLTSVQHSVSISTDLPIEFSKFWGKIDVDAATPLPLSASIEKPIAPRSDFWESGEGWISSDTGWEVWTGTVQYLPVDWKTPSRSSVRTLMDSGDGPPMLREGCTVVRGTDWNHGNDDGKDMYDAEKAKRDKEKKQAQEEEKVVDNERPSEEDQKESAAASDPAEGSEDEKPPGPTEVKAPVEPEKDSVKETEQKDSSSSKKAKKKHPSPKLPIGTVLSIEPWNGIPGMGRRVRWNLTGKEGIYRFGGDGGKYDLCHVEVNSRGTRIKKKQPLPESAEQCASRHGFGAERTYSVLLRLRKNGEKRVIDGETEYVHEGILEWPDFGAGIRVKCTRHRDGAVTIEETQLLFGSKDSGWAARFGQPSFVPGSVYVLSSTKMFQATLDIQSSMSSLYEEMLGSTSFDVSILRNPSDGSKLKVASELRLLRARRPANDVFDESISALSPLPPPITFDREYHASSLSLSRDGRTVSCTSSEGRGTAFASTGFTKGVHYWEVKLEQADIGSVFIGVAEKPTGSGSGSSYSYDSPPRLNRWHGWGFVNFRATYAAGAERVFGSHCHAGDTVGVLLDCDAGRVSYFYDGLKYGEHILNDLGCAFENLSPFGFNVDGCGSGGAGQGAPSGFENGPSSRYPAQGTIRPRTLWPVIGLRNQGDRVTLTSKWSTSYGIDGAVSLGNVVAVNQVLCAYSSTLEKPAPALDTHLPKWFLNEAFSEYKRWNGDFWTRSSTRGSGPHRLTGASLDSDFDSSPIACAAASSLLGLNYALLAGDRVRLTRSAGRILELAEEALVLGSYQGRLYYKIVSQKSEGGSLTEGGGRAWCWEENEVVDGLPFVLPGKGKGLGVTLPKLSRFTCLSPGGLRIIYENGAVLRSDLEIFDGSNNLGTIPVDTVIPRKDVLDRRVNSCGVVRFRVRYESLGEGWISARIRGGSEEPIIEALEEKPPDDVEGKTPPSFSTPFECATAWHTEWQKTASKTESTLANNTTTATDDFEQFSSLLSQAVFPGLSVVESDSLLVSAVNAISNYCDQGDAVECRMEEVASALSFARSINKGGSLTSSGTAIAANQAVATVFAEFDELPPLPALIARIALLRSLNRRLRLALPWMSIRPCQEGSAIFGGLSGHGASPDRAGRTHTVSGCRDRWVQVPSISTRIRSLRGLIFTSIKREFLQSLAEATTTPTPLSHDEYELPREIRTVRINRLKAGRAMLSDDRNAKRKYCVFAQLHNETKNWGGAALRRGYVAKGHGGQKRAFKVKLIGEGVNDYSGPYREAFTDAIAEVLQADKNGRGALGVLDPTPNNAASIGEKRDLFMFSLNGRQLDAVGLSVDRHEVGNAEDCIQRSVGSLLTPRDENSREVEEAVVFLGRISGTAFRHGIALDLPLPLGSVWKALAEEPVTFAKKLVELDYLAHRQLKNEKHVSKSALLWWQQRMLNAFAEGLSNVLPIEVLPLMSGGEIRDTLCGNPDVDVGLLKQVVEYEGYDDDNPVLDFFWETLHGMTSNERKQFLQFVWARNRLPMRASDFDAPFKIQRDSLNTGERADQALPSASTCFFSLTLPEYSSKDILREKLLFAINNVTTMETDFQTNSAEIAEGYRAF